MLTDSERVLCALASPHMREVEQRLLDVSRLPHDVDDVLRIMTHVHLALARCRLREDLVAAGVTQADEIMVRLDAKRRRARPSAP